MSADVSRCLKESLDMGCVLANTVFHGTTTPCHFRAVRTALYRKRGKTCHLLQFKLLKLRSQADSTRTRFRQFVFIYSRMRKVLSHMRCSLEKGLT